MSKPSQKTLVTLTTLRPESLKLAQHVPISEGIESSEPTALDLLISKAIFQATLIKQGNRDNALRAIFLGLLLYQIKNECEHGQFMRLATDRLPDISQRTRQDYMKLAAVYVETTKLALPDRLNIPDAQLAMSLDEGQGVEREMVDKAIKFIGELSLYELLVKHDIRGVGLKKELSEQVAAENETPLPPDEELRRRREQIFGECADHVVRLHKTLTNTEDLTLLESAQLDSIDSQLIEIRAAIASARKPAA